VSFRSRKSRPLARGSLERVTTLKKVGGPLPIITIADSDIVREKREVTLSLRKPSEERARMRAMSSDLADGQKSSFFSMEEIG